MEQPAKKGLRLVNELCGQWWWPRQVCAVPLLLLLILRCTPVCALAMQEIRKIRVIYRQCTQVSLAERNRAVSLDWETLEHVRSQREHIKYVQGLASGGYRRNAVWLGLPECWKHRPTWGKGERKTRRVLIASCRFKVRKVKQPFVRTDQVFAVATCDRFFLCSSVVRWSVAMASTCAELTGCKYCAAQRDITPPTAKHIHLVLHLVRIFAATEQANERQGVSFVARARMAQSKAKSSS